MSAPRRAVILAAGKGERLGEVTSRIPKPMLSVRGKPVLEHNVELLRRAGVQEICINLHVLPDTIRSHFGNGERFGVRIHYRVEPEIQGTAGGVREFATILEDEPFWVVYGDNFSDYDLPSVALGHRLSSADMTILLFEKDEAEARKSGVAVFDENQRILRFIEKPVEPVIPSRWINAGIYLMEASLLSRIPPGSCDFGRDCIPAWLASGIRIHAALMDHPVVAIDTPELYERAKNEQG